MEINGRIIARNTLFNFIGHAVTFISGIITIPLIIRGMGPERFGLLSLIWIAVGYFTIFDLGLGRATTKYVAEALGTGEQHKVTKLIWTSVSVQLLFGLIGTLILAGTTNLLVERVLNISPLLQEEARNSFYILACSVPIILVSGSFSGFLAARQRFDLLNVVRIPSSILTFLVPLYGSSVGWSLSIIILSLVFVKLLGLIAFLALNVIIYPDIKRSINLDRSLLRPLLVFGGWLTASNTLAPIIRYYDRFVIGSLISTAAIAYYTTPFDTMQRLWIIPSSLVLTLFPAFSTLIGLGQHDRIQELYTRSIKFLLSLTVPIFLLLIVFAKQILLLWLGPDFAFYSLLPFQILAFSSMIGIIAPIMDATLQGHGRPDIVTKVYLINTPLNFLFVWYMTKRYGLPGAAASAAIRTFVETIVLFYFTMKIVKLPIVKSLKRSRIIIITIAFNLLLAFLALLLHNMLTKIGVFAGMIIVHTAVTWNVIFKQNDRAFLSTMIMKILAMFRRALPR